MSEMTTSAPSPRTVALSLIKATALGEAARRVPGEDGSALANWEMRHGLTATLESWQTDGTLREDALVLTEWLAVELCVYLVQQLGDQDRMERWLRDFGDQVCQTQQHGHPAGPTAIEILSVVADDFAVHPQKPAGVDRLVQIGAPYLRYLRTGHEVEDAREVALTFALWAGPQLAALMLHDAERITSYMDAREHTAPRS